MGRREDFTVGRLNLAGANGYVSMMGSTYIPPDGQAGYPPGSTITLANAQLGMAPLWMNMGTMLSSAWRPVGYQPGWGIAAAGKKVWISGTAGLAILTPGFSADDGSVGFAGYVASDDNDQLNSTNLGQTDNALTITNSADPLSAHTANWGIIKPSCQPAWDIVFAGTRTTVGGAVTEAITLTGALATDLGFAQYSATDDSDTIAQVVMTANTMTITMSANPLTAHGHHYMVLRPRGVGRPSHYIAYAAKRTTVGGGVSEAITVTGALATDVVLCGFAVTDDTDQIRKAVLTANTLTITGSADPGVAHAHWYMILRAYPTS